MHKILTPLSLTAMLLLASCASQPIPVAVPPAKIPPAPPEVVKSVTTRQPLTPRFDSSAATLTDSYKTLADTLSKAIVPK